MIKLKDLLIEAAYVQDLSYINDLHKQIVNLLKKNKNVSEFSDHGPEDNKYAPGNYVSSFHVYGQKITIGSGSHTPGVDFNVTFSKSKMELFISGVGYFPIHKKVSGKDILKMVSSEKETIKL